MMMLVRLFRASFAAIGAIAVFAVCDDLPTGPSSDVVRPPQPMLSTVGGGSATLVAAGDIGVCNTTNAATLNDEETAKLLRALPEATVATLGDHVNVISGSFVSAADYANCYGASWGTADILSRTRPIPGNQDWNAPVGSTPGQVYFDYFNGAGAVDGPAGRRDQGYYAYDVGTWRVIALNNNVSTALNSPQYLWLKEELAAHPAQCTIAYWHAPLFFSAGQTIRTAVKPLWDLLYAAGAEIVLNSDNKFYERFAPQTPDGSVDLNFGIREFVVGTGGQGTSAPLSPPRVNSEKVISPTFGVLKLTLHENGYDWNFITIPSRPLAEPETGSGTCHGSPFPTARPNGPYVSEKTVTFDGRASFDPEGEALRYEWDFGDKSTHAGSLPEDATPTHAYAADGVYTVTLTVVDPNGERSFPATTTATIGNIAPAVNAGVDIATAPNTPVRVRANFSDPGLNDAAWLYSIDWGDGSQLTTGSLPTQDVVVGEHTYSAPNTYAVTVSVTDKDGATGSDVVMVEVSDDQVRGSYILTGAGDIAQCDGARMSEKTAKILKATPGTVFTLGDNAYPDGTAQEYRDCYGPGWGDPGIKARTFAVLGNHDYNTPGAGPSFDYFGAAVGPRGKGYYSYDLGPWHVIVLNNDNDELVPSSPGSEQFEWYKADLERSAATSRCTIIMAHQPYVYSSSTVDGDGIRPRNKPIWEEAYKWGVELILAGDLHRYERFRLQNPEAEPDDAYGIRQFIVGTGGGGTSMPGTIRAHSEVVSDAHGVLRLTLSSNQYSWKFMPVEGQTFTDEGSGTCHDPKPTEPDNHSPTANADQYSVAEDNTLDVTAAISASAIAGVLDNDVDADGDPLTAAIRSGAGPSNGTLQLNGDGTFTYSPNLNFYGVDQFAYDVSDGQGGTASATVKITVTPVNDAPVADDDAGYQTAEDQSLVIDASTGVLANDTDVEGESLTAEVAQNPASGTLSLNADGSFTYTPNVNFRGSDSFQYRASDGALESNIATVAITVAELNHPPVAADDPVYTLAEDQSLTTAATASVLANDSDSDAEALEAVLIETVPAAATQSFTLNADGTFSFTPAEDFAGTVEFTYAARDARGAASNVATATITVTAVNDAPVATAQTVVTDEDTPVLVGLTGSDVDGDALTFTIATQPANGTLVASSATPGTYTYTPNANFTGEDAFTFVAEDGSTSSAPVTVGISVGGTNDAPIASDDAASTTEDTPIAIEVLANDSDADGDELTVTLVSQPARGSVVLNSDGSFIYTPSEDFYGTDQFTYAVSDGTTGSAAPAAVIITVSPLNDAPLAAADSYTTAEDQALAIGAPGVLQNDLDGDGDALSAVVVSGPTNGALALNADGSFSYTPAASYNGTDAFTYQARDGQGGVATGTVTLTITSVNDAPVADAQSVTTAEDTPVSIALRGSDVDGEALTFSIATQPARGTLVAAGAGTFTYTPNANFTGTDQFTFTVADGSSASPPATVTITVGGVNDVPVATADQYAVDEDAVLSVTAAQSILANDTDADGDQLTASVVAGRGPARGTVTLSPNGTFTYAPNQNFNGTDEFAYEAADGKGGTATSTVTIAVNAVNDAPVALDDQGYTVPEDETLTTTAATGVTANDTDIDDSQLTAVVVSPPTSGNLTLNADGSFSYRANANFNGTDTFEYRASDGRLTSNVATVTIAVLAANDAPIAADDAFDVVEDTPRTFSVLGNDSDPEGSSLTPRLVDGQSPSNGTVSVNADGSITYTPAANFSGSDGFSYTVTDGNATSNAARVTLTVAAVNDVPVAQSQSVTVSEDQSVTITLSGQDVEGSQLAYTISQQPSHGTLTGGSNLYTYTPAPNYVGPDAFSFVVTDGTDQSPPATVSVTVSAMNDAPTAAADQYTVVEDNTLTVGAGQRILTNDSDTDGDVLTASLVAAEGPSNGTLSLNADGTFTYTPNANFSGTDEFTYQVSDGNGGTASSTVTIIVNGVNDAPDLQSVAAQSASEGVALTFTVAATDADASALTFSLVGAPSGAAIDGATGTFTWTPSEAQGPGTFTFAVRVQDDATPPLGDETTVTVTVTEANVAPVLNVIGAKQLAWGGTLTFTATATDADQPPNALAFTLLAAPTGATLNAGTGEFSWTPNDVQGPGSYPVTIRVSDGALTDEEQLTVTVTNVTPTVSTLSRTSSQVQANAADFTLDVTGEGFSPTSTIQWEGTNLVTTFASPTRLTASVPGARLASVGTYYIRVFNAAPGGGTSGKLAFFVTDAPAAVTSSSVATSEDATGTASAKTTGTATVEATGTGQGTIAVAQYDNNPGATPSFEATGLWFDINVDEGSGFTQVDIEFCNVGDGTFVRWWNAAAGAWEPVQPAAQLSGSCLTMTVTSTSKPSLADLRGDYFGIGKSGAPVAVDDVASVAEDTPLTINTLANDTDADGDNLSSVLVDPPAHGTLVHNADGSFSYTPAVNFNGTDSFTYRASDGLRQSGVATVTITVTAVNDRPVAMNDSYAADEDRTLTVASPGVLANDVDADVGQTLRATLVSGPTNGTLVLNENGSFTYTPKIHFSGADAFSYRTTDGVGSSDPVTVSITVNARMTVKLDMIPGSSTNSIGYSTSQTQIVFAIVSSATFDATLVDPATVTLGDELGTDTRLAKNSDGSFKFMLTDITGDGRRDFYAYVNKAEMKTNGDLTLATKSMTVLAGLKAPRTELLRGKDMVNVVP